MIVVYTATRSFYKYLRTALFSLLRYNRPSMVYLLIEDDAFPYEVDAPHKVINVSGIRIHGANADTTFSYMALLRPMLADIVPEDKVLYIDVDTVVCEDLTPLWETDMTGKYWGAVRESQEWYNPFGHSYYNNGVSLYNLKQMREDGLVAKLVKELEEVKYRFPDQDVMNKFCVPDKVVRLPVKYNESYACGFTQRPAIVHFAGIPNWYGNPYILRHEYLDEVIRQCEG